ncbi:protein neprosin [Rosa sericea]
MGKQLSWGGLIRLRGMVIILGVALIGYFGVLGEGNMFSKQKVLEVERKLSHLRKPAVKSIQSEDGDLIDCIDIYKQPAFDHPALKNHTIQMAPSYDPTKETESTMTKFERLERKRNQQSSMMVTQPWKKNGSCPEGTIPVRRIRKEDLLRASSVEAYGRKKHSSSRPHVLHESSTSHSNRTVNVQQANHSKAILLTEGYRYNGAKGDIKVWTPNVDFDDDYTTSKVCLINGPYWAFESVESGWAVNPSVYGDRQTRFMVYWTVDGSKKTGCFDLTCPGFVQTSHEIALGAAIYPISVPYGLPYEIIVYVFKDPVTSNWWVQYGEKINIGYWPPELFMALRVHAEAVEWGGEVYSARVGTNPHTKTGMGNGNFPDGIFGDSGVIKRIRIHDNSAELKFPEWVETYADEFNCYDVDYVSDYLEDPEFYYGGPGHNPKCP